MGPGDLCVVCHRSVLISIPKKPRTISTDAALLQRAGLDGCNACALVWEGICEAAGHMFDQKSFVKITCTMHQDAGVVVHSFKPSYKPIHIELYVTSRSQLDLLSSINRGSLWWQCFSVKFNIAPAQDTMVAVHKIQRWLGGCDSKHGKCKAVATMHPARLIHIGPGEIPNCNLYDSSIHTSAPKRYVTLSHCWGDPGFIAKTTKSNLESHKGQIHFGTLPQTFQDAIFIAKALGIFYLWIDSLCIVQDDDEDWARESAIMGNIYQNSYLTLAATSSADSNGGLFANYQSQHRGKKIERTINRTTVSIGCRIQPKHSALLSHSIGITDDTKKVITSDPLARRGWAYQERLLSSRCVHFTSEELVWECRSQQACECTTYNTTFQGQWSFGRPKMEFEHLREDLTNKSLVSLGLYNQVISDYTQRFLTFPSDRLPAFSGIAAALMPQDEYLAGLRRTYLGQDLAWFCTEPRTAPQDYRAPSWSWAAVDGKIDWPYADFFDAAPVNLWINEVWCERATTDMFGSVKNGLLKIWPLCARLWVEPTPPPKVGESETKLGSWMGLKWVRNSFPASKYVVMGGGYYTNMCVDRTDFNADVDEPVYGLWIWESEKRTSDIEKPLLVIRRIPGEDEVYERIGLCEVSFPMRLTRSGFTIL